MSVDGGGYSGDAPLFPPTQPARSPGHPPPPPPASGRAGRAGRTARGPAPRPHLLRSGIEAPGQSSLGGSRSVPASVGSPDSLLGAVGSRGRAGRGGAGRGRKRRRRDYETRPAGGGRTAPPPRAEAAALGAGPGRRPRSPRAPPPRSAHCGAGTCRWGPGTQAGPPPLPGIARFLGAPGIARQSEAEPRNPPSPPDPAKSRVSQTQRPPPPIFCVLPPVERGSVYEGGEASWEGGRENFPDFQKHLVT